MVRMKRNLKRFVCLCLAAVMLLGMMPGTAFAGNGGGADGDTGGGGSYQGDQSIYLATGASTFVRLSLVELKSASATSLGDMRVVNSMIVHNGLPTDPQNIKMVGNTFLDFAQDKMNGSSTTAKALMDSGTEFLDYTTSQGYNASGLSANGERPGLVWFSTGSPYGVTSAWKKSQNSLTAFETTAKNDNGDTVFVPTPFLEEVLGILFKGDSSGGPDPSDYQGLWGSLKPENFPYTLKFMSAVDPENAPSGTPEFKNGNKDLIPDEVKPENLAKYRLVVEVGVFVKKGNYQKGGDWVGYTLREASKITRGEINGIDAVYCQNADGLIRDMGGAFHTNKDQWYDMVVKDAANYAEFRYKESEVFLKPGSGSYSGGGASLNAARGGSGAGLSILTPYDFGSPGGGSGGGVTLKVKKIVDGGAGDTFYPFYVVVDARKFAANVMKNLPSDVKLTGITVSTSGTSGNAAHTFSWNNTDNSTTETHDPKLPASSSTLMWAYGVAQNGGELSYNVNWTLEYDENRHTENEINALVTQYISDITLFAKEIPVWSAGTTAASKDAVIDEGAADYAIVNGVCKETAFTAPGVSTSVIVDSPTNSLIGTFDDLEWSDKGFGYDAISFGTDKNGQDMFDSKSDIETGGALSWTSVQGGNEPAGIIHAEPGETVAELDFHNSLGFRFRKKLGVGEDSTSMDPNTEFEFKITSIKDNGAELDGSTVISYAKDAWMDTPGETQSKTYDELKNETLTASSNHGYTFFVPSTYEITIEELDDQGLGVTIFYSPGDDESSWTNLGDGPEGVLNSEHPDITFFNGERGGNCHVIIDYNLNGIAATGFHGNQSCIVITGDKNPIECGTVTAGEVIEKVTLNDEVKQEMKFEKDGTEITAKFLGIFTEPTGGEKLAGPEAITSGFKYTVPASTPNDHLIVLYAQWEWSAKGGGDGEIPEEQELYWIVFDHNYTGGPIITEAVGEIQMSGGEGDDEEEEEFVPCECGCVDPVVCTGGEDCTCCADGTKCCDACTCKPPAGDDEGDEDDGDGEGGGGTIKLGFYDPYEHIKDSIDDRNSMRTGWLFCGWSHEADDPNGLPTDPETGDTDTTYRGFEEDFMPEESATYYGIWFANDITWDANGGTIDGAAQYVQPGRIYMAADRVPAEVSVPVRTGYHFNGWFWDKECMDPIQEFESGVQPGQQNHLYNLF